MSLCLSQSKIRASQALWLLWVELLLLLDVRFPGGQPASSLLEVPSIVADSALRQVDNIWWPRLSFQGGEQCSDTDALYLSALSPWLSSRGAGQWSPAGNRGAVYQQEGSVQKPAPFEHLHSPLPLSLLWLTFLSSFQGLSPKEPSTTSLSAFVDANDTQGLSLAGGPGRWAALWTSAGGERQSRGLVHRLESRQAFRHRHGRWGAWMAGFAPAGLFPPPLYRATALEEGCFERLLRFYSRLYYVQPMNYLNPQSMLWG